MSSPQPYFAAHPAAAAVLALAAAAWAVSEYLIGRSHPVGAGEDPDAGSGLAVGLGLLVAYGGGLAVSLLVPATVITTGAGWLFVAGLVIAAAGQGLRLRAVHDLGSSFSFAVRTPPGRTVIDTGLYRRIRHPSYSGALACAFGFTVAYTNWLAPLAVLGLLLAYAVRIPREERVLAEGLGAPYRAYMRRTKRLIPFVF
ncbi:methyltransferase family protein [Rhodococcus kronopolitis]|uniref:Methyltransferase family protein n=1 Tax=Rhodococcus kronopolitis TaxID=1460226 RepID=A0ABV9FUX6_9NOCA